MGEFAQFKAQRLVDRLSSLTDDLSKLDGQIVALEVALKVLQKERTEVSQEVERLREQLQWQEIREA